MVLIWQVYKHKNKMILSKLRQLLKIWFKELGKKYDRFWFQTVIHKETKILGTTVRIRNV